MQSCGKKSAFCAWGLDVIFWAGQPAQAQPGADNATTGKNCPERWRVEQNGKWGYMDKTGLVVIPCKFDGAEDFSEGLAAVTGKNDKFDFIDKTGKFVIPPQYDRVGDFSEGLAAVQKFGERWPGNLAYINKKGEVVIKSMSTFPSSPDKIEFDLHYYRFCGGVARVSAGNEADEDAEGYINREGKFIWPKVPSSKKK